jgi:hypothetical protein
LSAAPRYLAVENLWLSAADEDVWRAESAWLLDDGRVGDAPLGSEDYESVLNAGRILHERGWIKAYTLNEQVDAWQHVVESVEEGYALTIDDYTNDLDVRGWLDRARSLVTRPVRLSLDDRLAALDARFTQATSAQWRHIPGAGPGWWYRVPKVLVGELREDVERLRLIEAE